MVVITDIQSATVSLQITEYTFASVQPPIFVGQNSLVFSIVQYLLHFMFHCSDPLDRLPDVASFLGCDISGTNIQKNAYSSFKGPGDFV